MDPSGIVRHDQKIARKKIPTPTTARAVHHEQTLTHLCHALTHLWRGLQQSS